MLLFIMVVFSSSCLSKKVNTAPASFPICTQAFRKIYEGTLSVASAKQQSWFTSYDGLYQKYNRVKTSDPKVLSLLSQLDKKTITPEAATTSFTSFQQSLVKETNALLL